MKERVSLVHIVALSGYYAPVLYPYLPPAVLSSPSIFLLLSTPITTLYPAGEQGVHQWMNPQLFVARDDEGEKEEEELQEELEESAVTSCGVLNSA
jgi:hypothetical protein